MKFFKRTDRELDRDLQSLRSKPSDEFILRISGTVLRSRSAVARSSRAKVGLAMGLTALGVIVFAAFGGLGYASSAASKATSVVSVVKVTTPAPAKVSVSSLPAPKTTTTTTTTSSSSSSSSSSASKVITWTGNGTTGGLCSSVSGTGSYQTWSFVLTSPYNGSGSTLSATFATAGSRTVTVTSTTSGGSNGAYQLPITTGKGDRLLSASATNGTANSVLTVSHCVLNGTTTGGGTGGSGGSGGHDSGDDNSSKDDNGSGGGGGGGGSCGGSGGGSDDDSSDGNSSDSKSGSKSSTEGKSSKHTRSVATNGGGSSHSGDNNSDDVSDDDDASSDDHSSGGGNGGGAGGDQYGGCIPICHSTSVGKYVLMLVSSADLAYHRAHGDLVPAPSKGCGGDDSNSGGSKCNSGRGNGSEGDSSQLIKPGTGSKGTSPTKDCDPGNSGGKNKGGD